MYVDLPLACGERPTRRRLADRVPGWRGLYQTGVG